MLCHQGQRPPHTCICLRPDHTQIHDDDHKNHDGNYDNNHDDDDDKNHDDEDDENEDLLNNIMKLQLILFGHSHLMIKNATLA